MSAGPFAAGAGLHNTTTNLIAAGTDRTVFVVCTQATRDGAAITFKRGTTAGQLAAFTQKDNGSRGTYVYSDGVSINDSIGTQPSLASPSILAWVYHVGSKIKFAVNNGSLTVTGGNCTSDSATDTGFTIGVDEGPGGTNFGGQICRILVFNSQLSTGDRTTVAHALAVLYRDPGSVAGPGVDRLEPDPCLAPRPANSTPLSSRPRARSPRGSRGAGRARRRRSSAAGTRRRCCRAGAGTRRAGAPRRRRASRRRRGSRRAPPSRSAAPIIPSVRTRCHPRERGEALERPGDDRRLRATPSSMRSSR